MMNSNDIYNNKEIKRILTNNEHIDKQKGNTVSDNEQNIPFEDINECETIDNAGKKHDEKSILRDDTDISLREHSNISSSTVNENDFPPINDDDDTEESQSSRSMPSNPFQDMLREASRLFGETMAHQRGGMPNVLQMGQSGSKTPTLDSLSTDMTAAARDKKYDPVVGREKEIARISEILCRRKKNNPILVGEPGVGKSAIVEGLAQQIADKTASPLLHGKRLVYLDLPAMVAGTKFRGEFEERMKAVIREIESDPDIIIFIDEIHTLIGAGSASGSMDAANILKPALARGGIQCIGATTLDEYRKSIEHDGALDRRFQKVLVNATTPEETLHIMQNIRERYQQYHKVRYSDAALKACVTLTDRYITSRQLPDKAIDALDEAGSRLHLLSSSVSPAVKHEETIIANLQARKKVAIANQNFELAAALRDEQDKHQKKLEALRAGVTDIDPSDFPEVTEMHICSVVSDMSGIPLHHLTSDERARLRVMVETLQQKVIGQDKAVSTVVRCIQRNRLGLHAPNRPVGAFMFLGPTGVGKTYLAQQIAREIFGSEDALIRIDMSEYNESFNTSRLVGAPPGYVGYDEGGQLTERVRRRPYSVILLDEIEKAHTNVYNLLLQVLDEGRLTDGNGNLTDFRNTIIIMTSNTGTRQLKDFGRGVGFSSPDLSAGLTEQSDAESQARADSIIKKALARQFAPEFLNRLDEIITFRQLTMPSIKKIVDIELREVRKRVSALGYRLSITETAKEYVGTKGYDIQFGARPIRRAVQQYIEDGICNLLLTESIEPGDTIKIRKPRNTDSLIIEWVANTK